MEQTKETTETNLEKEQEQAPVLDNNFETAQIVLKQLKEQNELLKTQLDRKESLLAHEQLSGQSNAGQIPKVKSEEDIANEQAKKLIAGSGYEDDLFPQ